MFNFSGKCFKMSGKVTLLYFGEKSGWYESAFAWWRIIHNYFYLGDRRLKGYTQYFEPIVEPEKDLRWLCAMIVHRWSETRPCDLLQTRLELFHWKPHGLSSLRYCEWNIDNLLLIIGESTRKRGVLSVS